jgi:molybdopterin-binding protein
VSLNQDTGASGKAKTGHFKLKIAGSIKKEDAWDNSFHENSKKMVNMVKYIYSSAKSNRARTKEKKMKISARNVFKGKVSEVKPGNVNTEVIIDIPGGMQVVSMISKESAAHLALKKGRTAYAVIKASSVMVAID